MNIKVLFFSIVIFVFLSGIVMSYLSNEHYKEVLDEYTERFSVGADIASVKSYLVEKGIDFSVEKSEDFSVLDERHVGKGYHSVLIFNGYSNRGDLISVLGQVDLLIEIGFDAEGKVIGVSSNKVNTLL